MDCPNCGTYNPEGRDRCWRCDKELPPPKPERKKNPQKSAQTWLYVAVAIFAVVTVLQMCGIWSPGGGQDAPSGAVPQRPAAVQQLVGPAVG
jgi:hypothetical protein